MRSVSAVGWLLIGVVLVTGAATLSPQLYGQELMAVSYASATRSGDFAVANPDAMSSSLAIPPEPLVITPVSTPPEKPPHFQWGHALAQASELLLIEHGFRMMTEQDLFKGPFWKQYARSVSAFHGWSDHDPFTVNYIGHPMQGAVVGFIQVQNDPAYAKLEFNESTAYWKSKLRASAFSAAFEVQFEMGPLSEASIGNIQLAGETGIVDMIITPVVGTGWMIAEDAVDKHLIKRVERTHHSRFTVALVRSFLNPSRSFANVMRWKKPWYRDNRRPGAGVY